jgi:hypothetical protein
MAVDSAGSRSNSGSGIPSLRRQDRGWSSAPPDSRSWAIAASQRGSTGQYGGGGGGGFFVAWALGGRLPGGAVREGESRNPAAVPVRSTAAVSAAAGETGGEGKAAEPDGCATKGADGLAGVCGDAGTSGLWFRIPAVGAPAVATAATRATRSASAAARLGRRREGVPDGRGEGGEGACERRQRIQSGAFVARARVLGSILAHETAAVRGSRV